MQKCFAEKMWVAFAVQKLLTFFQQKISEYCVLNLLKQLTKWPLTSSLSKRRFQQLGPDFLIFFSFHWVMKEEKKMNIMHKAH